MSGAYALTISSIYGAVTSSNVWLNVIPLVITNSPSSQTVLAGTNVNFSVTPAGWTPFNYQWQCNGTNISNATKYDFNSKQCSAGPSRNVCCCRRQCLRGCHQFQRAAGRDFNCDHSPASTAINFYRRLRIFHGHCGTSRPFHLPMAVEWVSNFRRTNNPLLVTGIVESGWCLFCDHSKWHWNCNQLQCHAQSVSKLHGALTIMDRRICSGPDQRRGRIRGWVSQPRPDKRRAGFGVGQNFYGQAKRPSRADQCDGHRSGRRSQHGTRRE